MMHNLELLPNRVYLEPPSNRRQSEFLTLERQSRKLHRPWIVAPATTDAYAVYLKRCRRTSVRSFYICIKDGGGLAGVVNITEIVGGLFQSAYLGFYAFAPTNRKGYMRDGLGLVFDRAFGEMGLHRLEANIQPENAASIALVKRLGFRLEGFSPKFLKIGGRWRDHERWAILADEWRKHRRRTSA